MILGKMIKLTKLIKTVKNEKAAKVCMYSLKEGKK